MLYSLCWKDHICTQILYSALVFGMYNDGTQRQFQPHLVSIQTCSSLSKVLCANYSSGAEFSIQPSLQV